MPINASEQRFLDALSLDAPWELIETFSRTPRWLPEDVNKAADMIAERLRRFGVPVELHEPEIYLSIPLSASVEADGETFRAKPPSAALSAPEGVTAPLVRLEANPHGLRSYSRDLSALFGDAIRSMEDLRARIAGRIAVMPGFSNPGLSSMLEEAGCAGVIPVNPGVDIHWNTCTTIWGSPELSDLPRKPGIPIAAVNRPNGEKLMALAASGGSATIRTELREGWFPQKVPIVTIPGAEMPDKFVLLHGHYDSWDVGVGDNATGDALLLELARVLWQERSRLKRSIRIAWWPGHSTGRYAGSAWFVDHFAEELDRDCLAQINCDSPGCRDATSYHETRTFSESGALAEATIRDIVPDAEIRIVRPPRAGDYSFNNIGLPSLFMLSSTMPEATKREKGYYAVSGCGGNIAWHTENDTLEIADREVLLTDARIYLLAALRIANAEILPFDWIKTCDEFLDTVAAYEKASNGLADLSPVRDEIERLQGLLIDLRTRPGKAADANEALHALSRVLVPVNHTRLPRFRHDPAYNVASLPALAIASEMPSLTPEQRKFAAVELKRGQNQVLGALRAAQSLVQRALA